MAPSYSPGCQVSLNKSSTDERATDILLPNLEALLVHYPPGAARMHNKKKEMERVSKYPTKFQAVEIGNDWRQPPQLRENKPGVLLGHWLAGIRSVELKCLLEVSITYPRDLSSFR